MHASFNREVGGTGVVGVLAADASRTLGGWSQIE